MKIIKLFLAIAVFSWMGQGLLFAQTADEELSVLLKRVIQLSISLQNQGYTVVHIGVDKLKITEEYTTSRLLHQGNEYKIAGIGGVGTNDLDIELYDENMNIIDEDRSIDSVLVVVAFPAWSGKFFLKINVASLDQGYSRNGEYFFCYVFGYKRR